jgi:hypothetical protein
MARAFISYTGEDISVAQQVCALLEDNGQSCWIAPRDVRGGETWAGEIVTAIQESTAVLVIVSVSASASKHVAREINLADGLDKPIIPLRVDDAPLGGELQYLLGNRQWVAIQPGGGEAGREELIKRLRELEGKAPAVQKPVLRAFVTWERKRMVGAFAFAVLLGILAGWGGASVSADTGTADRELVNSCYDSLQRLPTLAQLPSQTVQGLSTAIDGHVARCSPMFDSITSAQRRSSP